MKIGTTQKRPATAGFFYKGENEKLVRSIVREKLAIRKAEAICKGSDIVYTKTEWINADLLEELPATSEILKWGPIYRKQVIARAIRAEGYLPQCKSNKPLMKLML
jgi:hypothetical protein